ncbi:MAG TPA: tetratricopeptide repeat protein [Polyangiales bacterium]|jgi:serine/threonine-protein kinase|nr:tetratricopeptide repeat protein [Polyangiales bacterium]
MTAGEYSFVTDTGDGAHDDEPESLPLGTVIGAKYRILKLLGMGGNGAVYEGEHTSVGHRVAIKVVHQKLTNREEPLARFRREARICGSLRHPNIGQVYDVGELDDGSPYMVMELQEGRSLSDVIDETKLPIAAVIDIVRQLLAGLGAAHRAGSIHRDVKPDNVMIVRDHDGEVVVKLVDFGISKSIKPREGTGGDVTDENVIIGSPDYMAPEQLRGEALDVRTDIYAAGALLYESITGHLPYEVESLADLIATVLRDPPEKPTHWRPDCPPELERIVLKAMARDPAQRFESAEEMSRALGAARAAMRTAPAVSLAALSTPPPRPAASTPKRRRRTVDAHTIEDLRTQLQSSLRPRSRKVGIVAAVGGGAALLVLALVWMLHGNAAAPHEEVRATPLANTAPQAQPATTATAQAQPAAQPMPEPERAQPAQAEAQPAASAATAPSSALRNKALASAPPSATPSRARTKTTARAEASQPTAAASPVAAAPVDVSGLLKQAASAFALGQTQQALSLYQSVVKNAPHEAAAWRGLGVAANRLGQRAEAARAFTRYLALSPNAPDAPRVRQQLDNLQ